ncbi:hypothetical protein Pcinc_001053 [Petrolisthes cinctipes]|uniref:Uncharacterized protein n=1 Tax=Petrolisthes cinctipes TaxID=88211 RepID=A0AAE1L497_PETCI|nr:hypothetical protein Pcinc_001053 [Petrolisthes cinctipes]
MGNISQLANLLIQQTALSTQRDERMVAMMECLLSPGGVASTSSDHHPASSETPPKLNPASTPAPFLTSSASLRDFTAWKMKFDGYMLLTHVDKLPQKEQRAILLSLLDEDWDRVNRYALPNTEDTAVKEIVRVMEAHLRTQWNVFVDWRAETTVMGSQLARHLGIKVDNLLPTHESFSAVGGNLLQCKGQIGCSLELGKIVATDISQLPAWPHDFDPSEEIRAAHSAKIQAYFPCVFGGEAILCTMTSNPMVIELTSDMKLYAVTTARPLHYCWRDDIKKQLDEFRVKDIFAPINYPTDWCHPMVLVSKKDAGIRMRVDLTKLNKYI